MENEFSLKEIARIYSDFPGKFGIPRQSGILEQSKSTIRFSKNFARRDALRGLEEFSHLWLIWVFSLNPVTPWKATVRPPRLGGNIRKGVFATRSPFRPNPIGISCVRLEEIRFEPQLEIIVSGGDLADNTPILDIKPYLPYTDSHPEANSGWTSHCENFELSVEDPKGFLKKLPEEKRALLLQILAEDPRPAYHDSQRIYGFDFAGFSIHFFVCEKALRIESIEPCHKISKGF